MYVAVCLFCLFSFLLCHMGLNGLLKFWKISSHYFLAFLLIHFPPFSSGLYIWFRFKIPNISGNNPSSLPPSCLLNHLWYFLVFLCFIPDDFLKSVYQLTSSFKLYLVFYFIWFKIFLMIILFSCRSSIWLFFKLFRVLINFHCIFFYLPI